MEKLSLSLLGVTAAILLTAPIFNRIASAIATLQGTI